MRLLPKLEIDKKLADERRVHVEEGRKLAQRVDSLREIASQEEASLAKFRSETIAAIHKEISSESAKLDELKNEIRLKTKERDELMEPLHATLKEISERESAVSDKEAVLASKETEIATAQDEILASGKRAAEAEKAAALARMDAAAHNTVAAEARVQAKRELVAARSEASQRSRQLDEREAALLSRESFVAERENSATLEEARLSEKRAQLDREWRLLADRKEAFERRITKQ